MLKHLFESDNIFCLDAADSDDNGAIELEDALLLFRHLFAGAGPLPPPSLWCGLELPGDAFDCQGQDYCASW